jgi:uncharacterized protein
VAKLLLLAAVAFIVVLLVKGAARRNELPRPPQPRGSEDMVKCRVCGVNLPRSEAIMSRGRFYCGEEHRRQDGA